MTPGAGVRKETTVFVPSTSANCGAPGRCETTGAIRPTPWVHKDKIKVRQVTTLGLSFDHRIIDGELGSKFLRDVGAFLQDPEGALLAWT